VKEWGNIELKSIVSHIFGDGVNDIEKSTQLLIVDYFGFFLIDVNP
jgi:hypothetical protein